MANNRQLALAHTNPTSSEKPADPMFTPKRFMRPAEHEDAQLAWSYVLVDEKVSEDVRKQIVYVGQFSTSQFCLHLGIGPLNLIVNFHSTVQRFFGM